MTNGGEKVNNGNDKLERDRPPFTIIENAIIEDDKVSIYALTVYLILCMHADQESKKAWPGYERIANRARCSRRKAIAAIQELISLGYITKENRFRKKDKGQTSNIYKIF